LARTILAIRGIERAQVHLALPAPSLLRGSDQNARASVVLTLDPGTALAPEAVQGVVYVVSNSVEQLLPDNVAVMDDGGRLLSVPATAGSQGGHSGRQMELQRSVEEALAAKIQNLLEPVLGSNRVRAQVTAELSFEKVDRTIETVGPATTGTGAGSTGVAAASPDQASSREYQRREGSVGGLTRLTAAVLVDQAALIAGGDGGGAKPGIDLDKIKAMVGDAIGIDKERGDRLSVVAVPFEAAAVPADGGAVAASGSGGVNLVSLAERSVRPLVGLIAVVMIGLLALKSLRLPVPAVPSGARAAGTPTLAAPEPRPGVEPPRESSPAASAEPNLQVVRGWLNEG
jgi:flagellar M-ring protein FliF